MSGAVSGGTIDRGNYVSISAEVKRINDDIFFYNLKTTLKVIGITILLFTYILSIGAMVVPGIATIGPSIPSVILAVTGIFAIASYMTFTHALISLMKESADKKFWGMQAVLKDKLKKFSVEQEVAFNILPTNMLGTDIFIRSIKLDSFEVVNERCPGGSRECNYVQRARYNEIWTSYIYINQRADKMIFSGQAV